MVEPWNGHSLKIIAWKTWICTPIYFRIKSNHMYIYSISIYICDRNPPTLSQSFNVWSIYLPTFGLHFLMVNKQTLSPMEWCFPWKIRGSENCHGFASQESANKQKTTPLRVFLLPKHSMYGLVGGWTTHLKNISQIGSFPQVIVKKMFETRP